MGIRYAWYRALKQAEIAEFRCHDLQHSTASDLAMNGGELRRDRPRSSAHKTFSIVQPDAYLSEEHTHSVLDRMTSAIFR